MNTQCLALEFLVYKIVIGDGCDTEVLSRLARLEMATVAYMAAIARYALKTIPLAWKRTVLVIA